MTTATQAAENWQDGQVCYMSGRLSLESDKVYKPTKNQGRTQPTCVETCAGKLLEG